jgi:hypothetical protein
MKLKIVLICLAFVLGLLITSCGASKICPAYGSAAEANSVEANS